MRFETVLEHLRHAPKKWLITGVAGFIGSNLLEFLLEHDQWVTGLDNFSTGSQNNLDAVKQIVGDEKWKKFQFFEDDIRHLEICHTVCKDIDYILHQAALGSVPRSINDPITTNAVNINGFLNMLVAARDANIQSFVFAGSSSTYGNDEALPKIEDHIGTPLSPYAITKYVNELYADVFHNVYGLNTIGLRYFNVFGKRQNRFGAYAAVIPTWISAMINNEPIYIYGDGETSRDFCYVENVIQANILAATADETAKNQIYNIALNDTTTLNQLSIFLKHSLSKHKIHYTQSPIYKDFRPGDMRHSQADISKAKNLLGYHPQFKIEAGIEKAMPWFVEQLK